MRIENTNLLPSATAVALTSTFTSRAVELDHVTWMALQLVYTGTPTGSFKLQVSCDNPQPGLSPTNWNDLASSTTAVAGAAGSVLLNFADAGYNWVRLVYTFTSGTGSLTSARLNVKGT